MRTAEAFLRTTEVPDYCMEIYNKMKMDMICPKCGIHLAPQTFTIDRALNMDDEIESYTLKTLCPLCKSIISKTYHQSIRYRTYFERFKKCRKSKIIG